MHIVFKLWAVLSFVSQILAEHEAEIISGGRKRVSCVHPEHCACAYRHGSSTDGARSQGMLHLEIHLEDNIPLHLK